MNPIKKDQLKRIVEDLEESWKKQDYLILTSQPLDPISTSLTIGLLIHIVKELLGELP